ncbi:DNA-3-methyladenine glycosylase 2 family protein [Selenomonadales bacterium OttesenSCG-928-I06]|nr:DNA-3-methyladenine glycosylase 2 family protein [Selenomonadales bacterium OttesenSCG-928-I06]
MVFQYGEKEIEYLKKKDKLLGEAIDKIGMIERATNDDLFSSVVRHIVGQQISAVAQETVWRRMNDSLGLINAESISDIDVADLQKCGITFKKAGYIKDFACKVACGEFDINGLYLKSDAEVISELSAFGGIGVWTAEMLLIFSMRRSDILSFGDLAIQRGLRMLYHHRKIDRKLFEKYRRRYSPYGTVASLYLWAIAGGAIPGMKDYLIKKKAVQR